jgi:hypothetical protein
MENQHRERRDSGEHVDRPGLAERNRGNRQREPRDDRSDRGVAEDGENEDPDRGSDAADHRRNAEEGAAARRDHLPPAREAHEQRPPVPQHRRAARQNPGEMTDEDRREQRRHEPLRHVERHHGGPEASPIRPPDVRRPDVPATGLADVLAAHGAHEPVAGRNAAGQVSSQNEDCGAQVEIR